jgi:hypothetical protein
MVLIATDDEREMPGTKGYYERTRKGDPDLLRCPPENRVLVGASRPSTAGL